MTTEHHESQSAGNSQTPGSVDMNGTRATGAAPASPPKVRFVPYEPESQPRVRSSSNRADQPERPETLTWLAPNTSTPQGIRVQTPAEQQQTQQPQSRQLPVFTSTTHIPFGAAATATAPVPTGPSSGKTNLGTDANSAAAPQVAAHTENAFNSTTNTKETAQAQAQAPAQTEPANAKPVGGADVWEVPNTPAADATAAPVTLSLIHI